MISDKEWINEQMKRNNNKKTPHTERNKDLNISLKMLISAYLLNVNYFNYGALHFM